MLLRLLTFRSGGAGELTDQYLRGELRDAIRSEPGLRYMVAGRGAPEPAGQRAALTLWREPRLSVRELSRLLPIERNPLLTDARVELRDLAVIHESSGWEAASILRIFRGRAQPGVLERYLADVRRGTVEDADRGHGPLGLFLAQTGPDDFLTVSVWSSWSDIERATGGNIRQPFTTRHAYRLADGEAMHLEVVPGSGFAAAPDDHGARTPLPNPVAG